MGSSETESYKEKLKQLYFEQKKTLDLFLERGAISKAQYDKSLGDLTAKMKIDELIKDQITIQQKEPCADDTIWMMKYKMIALQNR